MKIPTILAVDDQPEYLHTYAAYFFEEHVPYKLISAVDGQMAIELASTENPDVIIMDWHMPVMDGLTAVKELKKDHVLRDIPVIMASGIMMSSEDLQNALEAGASDFIRKPVDRIELLARVNSHIRMAEYIHKLKDKNRIIEEEREGKINQLQEALHSICLQTEEMSTFLSKEYDELIAKLTKLKDDRSNSTEVIEQIRTLLLSNNNALRNYTSVCRKFMSEEEYIRRLLRKHPDLLPNEIELSLFLKKNTASKDIAAMTFRSVNTVKVARSRLRNKLGLRQSDNIVRYLMQF